VGGGKKGKGSPGEEKKARLTTASIRKGEDDIFNKGKRKEFLCRGGGERREQNNNNGL